MQIRLPSPLDRRSFSTGRGWTLVEMMVAIVAGMVVLIAVIVTAITLSRSMVAISNYYQLDVDSRHTLDLMSRDIRNADTLVSFATNSIQMSGTNYQGNYYTFTYNWDGTNVWRTFTLSGTATTSLVLSNCSYLTFDNYSRVPSTNFTFNAAGTNRTKLISVSWRCSRSILGQKLNTESVQTAKIVIRN